MKISSCSLALLSFVIVSLKNHDAFPCTNLSEIQSTSTSLRKILTYLYDPFADESTTSTRQREILRFKYDPYTDKSTTSTPRSTLLTYDPYTDTPTISTSQRTPPAFDALTDEPTTSTRQREILKFKYDPFPDKPATSIPQREILNYKYDPYTDKPTTSTSQKTPLTYDPYTDKSTASSTREKTLIYNPFAETPTTLTRPRETLKFTYVPFTAKMTWSLPTLSQSHRNRYNFRHRFRNPIVTVSPPSLTTFYRRTQKIPQTEIKTVANFQFNDMYKSLKEYAFIKTPLHSTPMVYLNITVPRILLEGKVPRLASPYIIKITLARRLAQRSNTTLPNRGFLRIVGSPVNMFKEGNLAMVLGKIASQIGNAYNMTGKDVQGMRHVIVVGPGGQMMNRRATPPKKTTVLTSPPMMTARVRLRPNCTLPKITDQVIYFEDYMKYFELY